MKIKNITITVEDNNGQEQQFTFSDFINQRNQDCKITNNTRRDYTKIGLTDYFDYNINIKLDCNGYNIIRKETEK